MSAQAVSQFIDQLKFKLWAGSDEELADTIGIGKSTLASWRRRGSIPDRVQKDFYYKYGVDYQLIATGLPCEDEQKHQLFSLAFYAAVVKIAKQADETELMAIAEWLSYHDSDLRGYLIEPVVSGQFGPLSSDAYRRLIDSVMTGDAASLEAFRRLQTEVAANAVDEMPEVQFPTSSPPAD